MMRMNVSIAMETAMKVYAEEIVNALASEYSFNAMEAYEKLGLSVEFSVSKGAGKSAASKKSVKNVVEEPTIPLPFDGKIREESCSAVKVNHGLYTQCYGHPSEEGLCKGCIKQMRKSNASEPEHGYISSRQMDGYTDGKGKSPIHYTKVMKKLNLNREKVEEEAAKFGVTLSEEHFAEPEMKKGRPKKEVVEVEKKSRGRPKKDEKEVEVSQSEDLFATLIQQAQSASPRPQVREEVVAEVVAEVVPEVAALVSEMVSSVASDDEVSAVSSESVGTKASKKSKEEVAASKAEKEEKKRQAAEAKAAKELQLAAAKAEKEAQAAEAKAAKELQLAAAKASKELKLAAAKAEKEALALLDKQEKERKAAEAKAAKELQLAAAKAEKEAQALLAKQEKEAAKAAAKAEKGSSKPSSKKNKKEEIAAPIAVAAPVAAPVAVVSEVVTPVVEKVADPVVEEEEEEEVPEVSVVKFAHGGKTYLKSSENILYDPETQDPVGMWNEETQSIDEVELTEEDYESEDE
jgi:hypothetical protein